MLMTYSRGQGRACSFSSARQMTLPAPAGRRGSCSRSVTAEAGCPPTGGFTVPGYTSTRSPISRRGLICRDLLERRLFAIRETSALWGIWAVAWIEPVCLETGTAVDLAHDMVLDALLGSARCDIGRTGRYSPAFARDTPVKQVHAQTKRLNVRYPLRIERPIYIDPVTGGLSLENE